MQLTHSPKGALTAPSSLQDLEQLLLLLPKRCVADQLLRASILVEQTLGCFTRSVGSPIAAASIHLDCRPPSMSPATPGGDRDRRRLVPDNALGHCARYSGSHGIMRAKPRSSARTTRRCSSRIREGDYMSVRLLLAFILIGSSGGCSAPAGVPPVTTGPVNSATWVSTQYPAGTQGSSSPGLPFQTQNSLPGGAANTPGL